VTDYSRNDPKENAASLLCVGNLFSKLMQTYIAAKIGCVRTGSDYRSFRPFYPRLPLSDKKILVSSDVRDR